VRVPGRLPLCGSVFASASGDQAGLVRHHERRIGADAEAANEGVDDLSRLAFLPYLLEQLACPRFADGTDVGDEFVTAHADARVVDGQGAPLRVGVEPDLQRVIVSEPLRPGQGLETQAVERV